MYIWLGIDLDSQLQQLKISRDNARKQLGMPVDNPNFPMHVSLKISFEVPNDVAPKVIDELCA